jgi:hypothetical protein
MNFIEEATKLHQLWLNGRKYLALSNLQKFDRVTAFAILTQWILLMLDTPNGYCHEWVEFIEELDPSLPDLENQIAIESVIEG